MTVRLTLEEHKLNTPWRVTQNWHGKIAIVDCTNNGKDTSSGRVCNLPKGKNERGLFIAEMICHLVNTNLKEN